MTEIAGKVAIVTGAASGIGRATAELLSREGAKHVAITDVNREGLEETAKNIRANGGNVSTHIIDVSDKEAVYAFADEIAAAHGGADIVINNAGVAQMARVEDLSYEDFEWVMDIDFWGMVYGSKAFLPQLQEKGAGHIVNVSSIFGLISVPSQAAYNSAKFAIRGFTEALLQEFEDTNIKVSSVHPGGIKTNIVRNARFLQSTTATEREEAKDGFDRIARTTPAKAAETIVNGIKKNKKRILIGFDARLVDWAQRLFPTRYAFMFRRQADGAGFNLD